MSTFFLFLFILFFAMKMLSIYRENSMRARVREREKESVRECVIGEVRAVNCNTNKNKWHVIATDIFAFYTMYPPNVNIDIHTHTLSRTRLTQIITESQFYVHLISMTLATNKQNRMATITITKTTTPCSTTTPQQQQP